VAVFVNRGAPFISRRAGKERAKPILMTAVHYVSLLWQLTSKSE
jgi:hypothetical protein